MLWNYSRYCCSGILVLTLVIMACAFYTYHVNSKRSDDDPKKKNYHPLAILFAPVTFPILAILYISSFILRVLVYGMFIILFSLALIIIRKPFILEAMQKTAIRIGGRLMEANTMLVRFFLNPWANSREPS